MKFYYQAGALTGRNLASMYEQIWVITGIEAFNPWGVKRGLKAKLWGPESWGNLNRVTLHEKDLYQLFMTLNALEKQGWAGDPEVEERKIYFR